MINDTFNRARVEKKVYVIKNYICVSDKIIN